MQGDPTAALAREEGPFVYLDTLALKGLQLEVFASLGPAQDPFVENGFLPVLPDLWTAFLAEAGKEGIPQALGLRTDAARQIWEVELTLVDNADMRRINHEYRHRDEATDVLSFALLADSVRDGGQGPAVWAALPQVQLGALFLSMEWAAQAVGEDRQQQRAYLAERFVHGLLHLMGVHHDTMAAYDRVVAIQKRVLDAASITDPTV